METEQNKGMAVLAYLGVLVIVPLLSAQNSSFTKFHTNQGLVNCILAVAYYVITGIIDNILYSISWSLGAMVGTIISLGSLIFVVLAIIGIRNVLHGEMKPLPMIGTINIIK